jgi:methionyl-tRNA synthetase
MHTSTPETPTGRHGTDGGPGLAPVHLRVAAGGETWLRQGEGQGEGQDLAIVVSGRGAVVVDGRPLPVGPGDVLQLEESGEHLLRSTGPGDLALVSLTLPPGRRGPEGGAARLDTPAAASFSPAFGIEVASIASAGAVGLAYGRIAAGGGTTPHHHDETEAFVVVEGEGAVVAGGAVHRLGPGAVVVIEPFEDHELRNTGARELLFLDLYWRDAARAAAAARASERQRFGGRPVFVFSSPPTPNGDLHLGHLSGPYLGADVYRRFQRLNGVAAYHLLFTDDYQSYVAGQARRDGTTPEAVVAGHAAEIRETLDLLDVALDEVFGTSTAPGYREGLLQLFDRLAASPAIAPRRDAAMVDAVTGDYLYEVDIEGTCPTCAAATGGNICEDCGEPNLCVDLVGPRSKRSAAAPRAADVERLSLPLHRFRDVVLDHHRRGKVSPRLQDLARRVFAREELDLPLTHPATWGVGAPGPAADGQVIWAWLGMAFAFLYGIERLGRRLGRDWQASGPRADWKIVHFFGYDNSFYHSILCPVLYAIAYPDWTPDVEYNVNEFYLLDDAKFSTSRRHAIWGRDVLTADTVDAVRWYLARTRGEVERTRFRLEEFREAAGERLAGVWQPWLDDLGRRVAHGFAGRAPDGGSWSPLQRAFLGRLQSRLERVALHYGSCGFALNDAVGEIDGLVDDAVRFARQHAGLAADPALADEHRTAVALELAAARLLAQVTAPVMPRFSARLSATLGQDAIDTWSDVVTLVTPGSEIRLAGTVFFDAEVIAAAGNQASTPVQA